MAWCHQPLSTNIDPDFCRHMVSLGHNELKYCFNQFPALLLSSLFHLPFCNPSKIQSPDKCQYWIVISTQHCSNALFSNAVELLWSCTKPLILIFYTETIKWWNFLSFTYYIFSCPVGHYCPSGTGAAIRCDNGTYQDQTTQPTCDACPAGYFCDNTMGIVVLDNDTTICPMGYYCPEGTRYNHEFPCPVGTFNNRTGELHWLIM